MDGFYDDDHPVSDAAKSMRLTNKYGAYSWVTLTECYVMKVLYPDDAKNKSKKYKEYNLLIIDSLTPLENVRCLSSMEGFEDGNDYTLRETDKLIDDGNVDWTSKNFDTAKFNGDRVVVGFINGIQTVPVILGVLPHPATKYAGKRELGRRRYWTHQGTSSEVDKDGNANVLLKEGKKINIKSKNFEITIDDDGKSVTVKAGDTQIEMKEDISITAAAGKIVKVNGDDYSMLKTEDFLTALSDAFTAVAAGTVAVLGVPTPIVFAPPNAIPTLIANIASGLYKSLKGKNG